MTTVTPVITELPGPGHGFDAWQVIWANMTNGQTGVPVDLLKYSDRSVQVEGTFGAGGNAEIQGSNDLANFRPLRDTGLNSLDFNSAGLKAILEMTGQIRPSITAGDGATSLTVTLLVRRTRS